MKEYKAGIDIGSTTIKPLAKINIGETASNKENTTIKSLCAMANFKKSYRPC